MRQFKKSIAPLRFQIFSLDIVRYVICGLRYLWFAKVTGSVRSFDLETNQVGKNTIHHNLFGLADVSVPRSHLLLRPIASLEYVRRNKGNLRVLTIGPRTEGEIYNLISYGFKKDNIRGLDLISYSPLIDLGDMHAMPYADSSFDVVVAGWVIAYSDDREAAAREIARITKSGGIVAMGVSWSPRTDESVVEELGYLPSSENRIDSVDTLLDFFSPAVGDVYFRQDVEDRLANAKTNILSVFSIKKEKSSDQISDH